MPDAWVILEKCHRDALAQRQSTEDLYMTIAAIVSLNEVLLYGGILIAGLLLGKVLTKKVGPSKRAVRRQSEMQEHLDVKTPSH